jgi:signal transduction histidine kinase
VEFVNAYSAVEACKAFTEHTDTAVVLLDVVMETDDAGLRCVEFIRKTMGNKQVRIILRTGQPGQAPERQVIVDYDINDYKAKTELTADKLFTALTAALRGYQQLQRMVETRRGLEIIIDAASELFDFKSMQRLAGGVLTQIASLLNVDCAGILVLRDSGRDGKGPSVLAASGCYRDLTGVDVEQALAPDLKLLVQQAFERRCHDFAPHRSVLYIQTGSGREVVVLLEAPRPLSPTDRTLVEVFCSRLSASFDNVILYEQLQEANNRLEERVTQRTRELTHANQRLAAQWSRLRRANAFKNEVLGRVAHDLKNPLGVIMGRAEILTEFIGAATIPTDKAQAQVEHIRDSAKRLTAMVDTLIADAMVDALDITIRHDPVELVALVEEVIEAGQPLAEKKKQIIRISRPPSFVINGDTDRLREAIDNIVGNAIKYTPIGGKIDVEVATVGGEAFIRVRDNGPGLSPEDQGRLFGRFQRLSAKPTGGESSTGLGLSIAKQIIDLHGGRITAESGGAGKGTTFAIVLPLGQG